LKKEPANLFDIWKKSDFSSFEMRLSFWLWLNIGLYIYIYSEWEEKRDCVCVCSKEVTFSISKAEIEFCLGERQTAHQKKKKTFWALVRLVLTVSQANDIPFILYTYYMIIYKKADVISTLGSHNTLIPRHGTPSKVIFRTLRILMSMMIDLFIHQWREIFIWTMPSDQTTPRACGRFSNLFSGWTQ
jgi:hypothetical protein